MTSIKTLLFLVAVAEGILSGCGTPATTAIAGGSYDDSVCQPCKVAEGIAEVCSQYEMTACANGAQPYYCVGNQTPPVYETMTVPYCSSELQLDDTTGHRITCCP